MNILKLPPYYYPEAISSSHLTKDLEEAYSQAGFNTIVFAPTPTRGISDAVYKEYKDITYEERYDGRIQIHRFPMFREGKNPVGRAIRYFLVHWKQYWKAIKESDTDIISAGSTPPTQGMLSALVAKRLSKKYKKKVPFVYNLQDIFPDSLVSTGLTRKGSVLWKIGRKIENYTYQNADKIIVISEGFKRNIMAKGVPEEKIEVISNWIDLDSVHPVSREENKLLSEFPIDPTKFLVVYAGNFGASQGADIILKAAEKLRDKQEIQFVIFGGGAYFEDAKRIADTMDNVFIHELLPADRISEVYSLGDVALITCKPGTGNAGMPSKTWSIMACNTPIIASFDTDSDLADVIRDSGAGKCVEPGNVQELLDALKERYQLWKSGIKEDVHLREYVKENASRDKCVGRYVDMIKGYYMVDSEPG